MPRTARKLIDGGIYYTLTRGNNGQHLFLRPSDYAQYFDLLCDQFRARGIKLYHFSLLPGQVELVVRTPIGPALSKAMSILNLRYAVFYRRRYKYFGHLWHGRFKSLFIDYQRDLFYCARFVELSAVREGLAKDPDAYPWSSYLVYAHGVPNSLLHLNPLYDRMGTTNQTRRQNYRDFIHRGLKDIALAAPTDSLGLVGNILPHRSRTLEEELGLARPRGRPRRNDASKSAN